MNKVEEGALGSGRWIMSDGGWVGGGQGAVGTGTRPRACDGYVYVPLLFTIHSLCS